ncbi:MULTISPECIES: DUF2922 domain-containing protein [Ureibacillus]|jgi:Protein of unknown function (DUF2922)|uniref:DUF2922 domain-containing protein n=1 Tax=Ureibacillus thermosphaericus TaxID=51173 RepID=A0A840PJK1_URETH|nr:DUF2922 domain-containing protein [Ureibacillus thermosphaericus]MBB5148585.1 hypothetical protein [Ureibacillus thermosphaericus]NKZ31303.1 DUF2922 domain-containing protein [Ureibacillus thermosphaericus]
MTSVLEMKFEAANGKILTLSLNDPKPNLTSTDVSNAMQMIINQDVFHLDGAPLAGVKQARLIDKTITDIL